MPIFNDPTISTLARFLDVNIFRSELVMSNMANIDTPGYRTRDINFSQEMERAGGDSNEGGDGALSYASFSPLSRPGAGPDRAARRKQCEHGAREPSPGGYPDAV